MEIFGRKLTRGLAMVLVGFAMILYSAGNYIFRTGNQRPAIGTIGIVFLAVGMGLSKKENRSKTEKKKGRKNP